MNKRELRLDAKCIIKQLSPQYKQGASKLICDKVLSLKEYQEASNIFIYLSTLDEVDTSLIIKDAVENNKNIYVPKCIGKKMLAVKYNESLVKNRYGILEPESIFDTIEVDKIDMAVVPCLMASLDNKRLGHGMGYYDRFLDEKVFKLCLCFKELLSDEIEMDNHDVYMDLVVHE